MIADSEVVALLPASQTRSTGETDVLAYTIDDVRLRPGAIDLRLSQAAISARLVVSLPSSGRRQPWAYVTPDDAADWVGQLLVWIDEEMYTDGLGPSRARDELSGESYVIVESYGWRLSDLHEHTRLVSVLPQRPL